jgi:hypothetical protein
MGSGPRDAASLAREAADIRLCHGVAVAPQEAEDVPDRHGLAAFVAGLQPFPEVVVWAVGLPASHPSPRWARRS